MAQCHTAADASDCTDWESRGRADWEARGRTDWGSSDRTEGPATAAADSCSYTAQPRKAEPAVVVAVGRSRTRTAGTGTAARVRTAAEERGRRCGGSRR